MGDLVDGSSSDSPDLEVICETGQDAGEGEKISLAEAARKGRPAVVRRLLQKQADPNSLDPQAKACPTPLMAAAAGGSVGVVAVLLLAGADPGLRSPAGAAAADLTSSAAVGRMLAAFGRELEAELGEAPAPPGSAARAEALGRVRARGVPLIEQALQKPLRGRLARGHRADVTGADARQARKRRCEEREAARLQRVAEKAAARRSQEDEEARLQRVAQKAAKRRASRALRKERVRKWREEKGRDRHDRHRSRRRRRRSAERSSRRSSKAEPKASSECFMCPACSWCGERAACGVCGELGVCSGCSTCSICGRVSGFCAAPAVAAIPGYHGALGRPEMSGMNKPEEAFPQAAYIRSEKKRKRRSESRSRDRKGGSKADRGGGGQARSGQPREPAEEDGSGSECSDGSYTYSYCSEDASAPGSPPPA